MRALLALSQCPTLTKLHHQHSLFCCLFRYCLYRFLDRSVILLYLFHWFSPCDVAHSVASSAFITYNFYLSSAFVLLLTPAEHRTVLINDIYFNLLFNLQLNTFHTQLLTSCQNLYRFRNMTKDGYLLENASDWMEIQRNMLIICHWISFKGGGRVRIEARLLKTNRTNNRLDVILTLKPYKWKTSNSLKVQYSRRRLFHALVSISNVNCVLLHEDIIWI